MLLIFIDERQHNTISVLEEGAIEYILGPKYGFTASKAFSGKF